MKKFFAGVAIAAALVLGSVIAAPASATTKAPAIPVSYSQVQNLPQGGSGDFYKSRTCWSSAAISDNDANLHITNYDISSGQQYHIDMDGDTDPIIDVVSYRVYHDGIAFSKTNDFYWNDSVRSRLHDFRGTWTQGGTEKSGGQCYIYDM